MDAIQIIMLLLLTLNEPCTALPDQQTDLQGQTYKIEPYRCGDAQVRVWSVWCAEARGYWSRPFLMEDEHSGKGVYLNRFAELQTGWHVALDEVYRPHCGA